MVTSEAMIGQSEGMDFHFPDEDEKPLKDRLGSFLDERSNGLEIQFGKENIGNILEGAKKVIEKVLMHAYFALEKSRVMSFIDKNPIDGVEDVAAIAALIAWPYVQELISKQAA